MSLNYPKLLKLYLLPFWVFTKIWMHSSDRITNVFDFMHELTGYNIEWRPHGLKSKIPINFTLEQHKTLNLNLLTVLQMAKVTELPAGCWSLWGTRQGSVLTVQRNSTSVLKSRIIFEKHLSFLKVCLYGCYTKVNNFCIKCSHSLAYLVNYAALLHEKSGKWNYDERLYLILTTFCKLVQLVWLINSDLMLQ